MTAGALILAALQTMAGGTIDTSQLATKADLQTVLNGVMPPVCSAIMPPDSAAGSVGTDIACTPRQDSTRPTVIKAKDTITDATGGYSIAWDQPFSAVPTYADAKVSGSSQPYVCTVSATATMVSGRCFQLVTTQLPTLATALPGLLISPFVNAAAGMSVRVVARQ